MANIFKNIILILVLSAIIIMMIGIVFYDYIPNGTEVKEPNEYVAEEKTTKTLATIKEEKTELFGTTSTNKNDKTEKTETVLHAYSLDAGDLKIYEQSKSYVSGKSDPFEEISNGTSSSVEGTTSNNLSGNASNGNNSNNNTNTSNKNNSNTVTQVTDGTLFNSTTSK